MEKPVIIFSHANGFPAVCYHQVLIGLENAGYEVKYINCLGHNPKYPVLDSWDNMVNEVLALVQETPNKPIIGIGHSLGGVLTLNAAMREPSYFKSIILLDIPLLSVFKERLFKFLKKFELHRHLMPGRGTKYRKRTFESVELAMKHFMQKSIFKNFDERCLYDYVTKGTYKTDKGFELLFSPEIEEKIYSTIPYDFSRLTKFSGVPGCFIYGQKSDVVGKFDLIRFKRTGFKTQAIPGSHLFPFEYPEETVDAILMALKQME